MLEFFESRTRCRSVSEKGIRLVTIVPASPLFQFNSNCIRPRLRYALSRFAYTRRDGRNLILESPLSHAFLILHDPRAISLVFRLTQPLRYSEIPKVIPGILKKTAFLLLQVFYNAGALTSVSKIDELVEDRDDSLLQWEFHDLLFHSRSRLGRHANPFGRTNHFVGKVEQPPVVKPKMCKNSIQLYRPDINALRQNDIPFTHVLEERRSQREHSNRAISVQDLGEFLYRTARVRKIYSVKGVKFTDRVYPCSGAAYELEIYLAINRCKGIPSGLFHYSPVDHQLYRLSGLTRTVKSLLTSASHTAHTNIPQVLIIVTARFQRMSWKYESISYASILKDVGVLFQTLYLVASAMGLSACALGVGNSDLFSEAANLNYYMESSVGEFILGR